MAAFIMELSYRRLEMNRAIESFYQYFLRVIKPTRFLPEGTVCFCFREQDGEFWVSTSQDFNGVRQFGFEDKHRHYFEIYGK